MKPQKALVPTHPVEGEFIGFIPKPKKPFKYMQLRVGERTLTIKLAKELQETLGKELQERDRVTVFLEQKSLLLASPLKLKTDHVEKHNSDNFSSVFQASSASKQGKILLCYNSSCVKRGGKKLYHALIETLQNLGLQDQVKIQLTGCQKQCKKAPSFILMPGKVTHNYLHPKELSSILTSHYLKKVDPIPNDSSEKSVPIHAQ